jgi:hypothetical protein
MRRRRPGAGAQLHRLTTQPLGPQVSFSPLRIGCELARNVVVEDIVKSAVLAARLRPPLADPLSGGRDHRGNQHEQIDLDALADERRRDRCTPRAPASRTQDSPRSPALPQTPPRPPRLAPPPSPDRAHLRRPDNPVTIHGNTPDNRFTVTYDAWRRAAGPGPHKRTRDIRASPRSLPAVNRAGRPLELETRLELHDGAARHGTALRQRWRCVRDRRGQVTNLARRSLTFVCAQPALRGPPSSEPNPQLSAGIRLCKRRGWDSNPRSTERPTRVFETVQFRANARWLLGSVTGGNAAGNELQRLRLIAPSRSPAARKASSYPHHRHRHRALARAAGRLSGGVVHARLLPWRLRPCLATASCRSQVTLGFDPTRFQTEPQACYRVLAARTPLGRVAPDCFTRERSLIEARTPLQGPAGTAGCRKPATAASGCRTRT